MSKLLVHVLLLVLVVADRSSLLAEWYTNVHVLASHSVMYVMLSVCMDHVDGIKEWRLGWRYKPLAK